MTQGRGAGPGFYVAPTCDAYMSRVWLRHSARCYLENIILNARRSVTCQISQKLRFVSTGIVPVQASCQLLFAAFALAWRAAHSLHTWIPFGRKYTSREKSLHEKTQGCAWCGCDGNGVRNSIVQLALGFSVGLLVRFDGRGKQGKSDCQADVLL